MPKIACSDDGYVDAQSGSARLMSDHPSISMSDEYVRIDIGPKTYNVKATFQFYNAGESTTVAVGFPVEGYPMNKPETGFLSFKTWFDGKEVRTADMPNPDFKSSNDQGYSYFKVKRVFFAARSTSTSVVEYTSPYGGTSIGSIDVYYSYGTGRSWHGDIGRALFDIRFSEDLVGLDVNFSGGPTASRLNRSRGQLVFGMKNIKPDTGGGLSIDFRRSDQCGVRDKYICQYFVENAPTDPTLTSLRLQRNTAYARHGRVFKDAFLKNVFNNINWYSPRPDFSETDLNEAEHQEVAALKKEEEAIAHSPSYNPLSTEQPAALSVLSGKKVRKKSKVQYDAEQNQQP